MRIRTCRFCRSHDPLEGLEPIKYGVRHYAHPDCLLKAKGADAFTDMSDYQINAFPALAAHRAGLLDLLVEKHRGRTERR